MKWQKLNSSTSSSHGGMCTESAPRELFVYSKVNKVCFKVLQKRRTFFLPASYFKNSVSPWHKFPFKNNFNKVLHIVFWHAQMHKLLACAWLESYLQVNGQGDIQPEWDPNFKYTLNDLMNILPITFQSTWNNKLLCFEEMDSCSKALEKKLSAE